jgi:RNA polymerase sigma-70 factor (ECF subfamily)
VSTDPPSLPSPSKGEESVDANRLLPLVYVELRRLARAYMRRERVSHTLQPTALVHEAYMRMSNVNRIDWRGRTHFFAMAATQMRRVLVEHARAAGRRKRGAKPLRVELGEGVALTEALSFDLLAIDEGLEQLARRSERQARVAELRLFAGMTAAEIASIVAVSERTVKQDWRIARAWISRRLRSDGGDSS